MKKWIVIIILLIAVGWVVFDFVIDGESASEEELENEMLEGGAGGLQEGDLAPDFELETTDGETVQLSDFRGEKVLLNFWATWCPPCRDEIPDMQKYHEEDEEGVILAVNLTETEQEFDQIGDFLEEFGVTFRVLLDENTSVSGLYDAFALPTSYFINTDGTIHTKAIGAINYDLLVEQFQEME